MLLHKLALSLQQRKQPVAHKLLAQQQPLRAPEAGQVSPTDGAATSSYSSNQRH